MMAAPLLLSLDSHMSHTRHMSHIRHMSHTRHIHMSHVT